MFVQCAYILVKLIISPWLVSLLLLLLLLWWWWLLIILATIRDTLNTKCKMHRMGMDFVLMMMMMMGCESEASVIIHHALLIESRQFSNQNRNISSVHWSSFDKANQIVYIICLNGKLNVIFFYRQISKCAHSKLEN